MDERFKRIDLKIEKILDTDFRYQLFEMLQEAGIESTEANSIILNKYKQAIKKFSIARLKEVINCIEKEDIAHLEELICNSPAGDGYGQDNKYIDFGIVGLDDIGDVCTTLKNLAHGKEC